MTNRYVELLSGESWELVSTNFGDWLLSRIGNNSAGWSEGDTVQLEDGKKLVCFKIPDKHNVCIKLFEEWAHSLARVYAIEEFNKIVFPKNEYIPIQLPVVVPKNAPPWLR